jgi:hypothetical protein
MATISTATGMRGLRRPHGPRPGEDRPTMNSRRLSTARPRTAPGRCSSTRGEDDGGHRRAGERRRQKAVETAVRGKGREWRCREFPGAAVARAATMTIPVSKQPVRRAGHRSCVSAIGAVCLRNRSGTVR